MRVVLRRRWLLWAAVGIVGLLVTSFALVMLLYPKLGAWAIRDKVVPRLEARLGRDIEIRRVSVSRGQVVLEGVTVRGERDSERGPLATVERISADFAFWPSLRGEVRLGAVTVEGARGLAVRLSDGTDNFSDLIRRLGLAGDDGDEHGDASASRTGLGFRPARLVVTGAGFELHDAAADITVAATDITAELGAELGGERGERGEGARTAMRVEIGGLDVRTGFGPAASARRIVVTADAADPARTTHASVLGGRAALWPGMTLTAIQGTIAPGDTPGQLEIDLRGSWGGADETLWTAVGSIDPLAESGAIHLEADKFELSRIRAVLEGSALVDYDDTSVNTAVDIAIDGDRATIRGEFAVSDVNVFHPMLAEKVVRDIDVTGTIEAALDRTSRTLTVARADLHARDVAFEFTGALRIPGGLDPESGVRRAHPHVTARLVIPPVPCQTMLEAIPRELMPYLAGFQLRGAFETDLRVDIDWADLQATALEGWVGINGCKVREAPEDAGVERLRGSFTHYVEVEVDQWYDFVIGPENPDFVPLWDVSPHLVNSLMSTEDSRFYKHKGFIVREFRTALIKNLEAGYFRYGASSITMQTVKNVLLYREKTLSRKLQELFLTWYIEQVLEKDRILEIYVNAIEYGPGLYGIGPAARHFFGKHPRDLGPVEAAYFSSILPSPKRRYQQYCENRLWRWTESKVARILALMHKRELLTDDEFEVAKTTPLVFDLTELGDETARDCKRRARRAIEKARPTNPLKK